MTYEESLQYIHSICWRGSRPGLSRTEELLGKMGNPQNRLRFIHVAGTNGKGSFCSMLSSVLQKAGYHIGTYTSPYILRFNERMKVDGLDIPDDTLAELVEKIRPIADSMQDPPTEFELITAIAMEYFAREKCEYVVLECGMGGRLDSTNIIETSILSVITGIALDHTAFLGDTIAAIAGEKAGIIKEGIPVLWCGTDPSAHTVIEARAKEKNAPFYTVPRDTMEIHSADLEGTLFSQIGWEKVFLPLLGSYQPRNACNVLRAVELLNTLGLVIPREAVYGGLKEARWPARYEVVNREPLLLCDGGHNPEGVEGAVESTKLYFREKVLVLTGVMADKDYEYMAKKISEVAKFAFCITPDNPRALKAEDFAETFRKVGVPAQSYGSVSEALAAALETAEKEHCAVLSLGSLYMYGQVIDALHQLRG